MYDTDGAGHCTVGWGHLVHKGKCDGRENERLFLNGITRNKADQIFNSDVLHAEKAVLNEIAKNSITLDQNQFDALVSFTYNVGTGNLRKMFYGCKSPNGDIDLTKLPTCIQKYDKAGGRTLPGLTRRRQREADLFEGIIHE